jgi:hypothetical protein
VGCELPENFVASLGRLMTGKFKRDAPGCAGPTYDAAILQIRGLLPRPREESDQGKQNPRPFASPHKIPRNAGCQVLKIES